MIPTLMLGKSPLRSAPLGYGCMRLVGDGSPEALRRGEAALLAACEAGYNLFDHADIYGGGRCEEHFGAFLRQHPHLREGMLVTTKCGIRMRGVPSAEAPQRYDFSREHLVASCEGSLRRLGVETLDLLRLHRPDFLCDPTEVAEAFETLQRQGKVRHFGVSNFSPSQVRALQAACPMPLVVNQIELSLGKLTALTDGTLDQCLELNITPEAWCPIAGLQHPSAQFDEEARGRVTQELAHQAERYAAAPETVALAWLLRHPAGILPLIGSTQPERIHAATGAVALDYQREDWYRLLEARHGHRVA